MANLELKSALMHEDSFFVGIGSIKKELTTDVNPLSGTAVAESIALLENGLVEVVIKNKGNKDVTLLIPLVNFKQLVPKA